MCRSIKVLRTAGEHPDEAEIREAALQFVRKISGYRSPSRVNADVFDNAVDEIAEASRKLLDSLTARQPAKAAGPRA